MGIGAHLTHRCTVQRKSQSGTDGHNNPTYTWADQDTDVHCRLFEKKLRTLTDQQAEFVVVTEYRMLFERSADVLAGDRITDVVLDDGTEPGLTYVIDELLPRRVGRRESSHISNRLRHIS